MVKNRFQPKKKKHAQLLKNIALPVALFALVVGLFYQGIGSVSRTTTAERLRSAEQAVTKAAVQCYAIEGRYAPSLEYLEDHYGLSVDREEYIVQYDVFATNIMPTILVLPRDLEPVGEEAQSFGFE